MYQDPRQTALTLVDLMNKHIDTKRSHPFKQQQILLIIELSLEQVFHPNLFPPNNRTVAVVAISTSTTTRYAAPARTSSKRGTVHSDCTRYRHFESKDSNFVGGNDEVDFVVLAGRVLRDAEEDT